VTASDWLSIAAIVVSLIAVGLGQWRWHTERRDRRAAIDAEAATREAERAADTEARAKERDDVAVVVSIVLDPNNTIYRWWRLELTGGTPQSRTTVNTLRAWTGAGRAPSFDTNEPGWFDVLAAADHDGVPLSLFGSQRIHLKAANPPATNHDTVTIYVAWGSGTSWRAMQRKIHVEPWG
jgi:hypothetical protein